MDFTSLEDLKIRIYPALRNRVSYFKKLGVNDITEEDISIVKNPDRGLYKLVQVELQKEEENFDDFEKKYNIRQ